MRRKKEKLPVELGRGQKLVLVERETTGNLGQKDVDHYDVINAKGEKVGTVTHTAHTALKPPFRTTNLLLQKDADGKVIVDTRW